MSFFRKNKERVSESVGDNGGAWDDMGPTFEQRQAEQKKAEIEKTQSDKVKHDARIYYFADTRRWGDIDANGCMGSPEDNYLARGNFNRHCQDFISKIRNGEWTHDDDVIFIEHIGKPMDKADGGVNYQGVVGAWQKVMNASSRDNGAMNNIVVNAIGRKADSLKMISNSDIEELINEYPTVIDYEDMFETAFLDGMGDGYAKQSMELKKAVYGKQFEYNERLKTHHRWAETGGRINRADEGIEK